MQKLHKRRESYGFEKKGELGPPDMTVTAATGPTGTEFLAYKLHKTVLSSKSIYFKNVIRKSRFSGYMDVFPLPCIDEFSVFPYLIKFMYEGVCTWGEDKKVPVCALALCLEIPELLHIAKSQLLTDSTQSLVKTLQVSYNVVGIDEFVVPVTSVLAKRIHKVQEEPYFYGLNPDLLEMVLRSPNVALNELKDLKMFIHRYVKAREKKFGDKITLRRLRGLETLADQLMKLKDVLDKYSEKFKETNKVNFVPQRSINAVQDHFYSSLRGVRDLEGWTYHPKPELMVMRVSIPLKPVAKSQSQQAADTKAEEAAAMRISVKEMNSIDIGQASGSGITSKVTSVEHLPDSSISSFLHSINSIMALDPITETSTHTKPTLDILTRFVQSDTSVLLPQHQPSHLPPKSTIFETSSNSIQSHSDPLTSQTNAPTPQHHPKKPAARKARIITD